MKLLLEKHIQCPITGLTITGVKKKSLACLMFSVITFFSGITYGQSLANYASTYNTGVTYTSINVSGNSFNSWRNTATFTQDDNRSDFTNIGFDFWYNGMRYTQFCVSTNGFIDFSTSANNGGPVANAFGYDNTAFTNSNLSNSTNPAIAPFYDDLTAQGGVNALGTSIKYFLSGATPNRTLTIEWINMAVYGNTTPSLNFQVRLVETTGQILIHYGAMSAGTQTFSYSMGLNSSTLSATPTAAQLKALQTVNVNSFGNTVQNNLSAMPTANSQYVFTSPAPTATSGGLSFTGVSQTGMTLNWTNWATNEVGYVIYNSLDGINYTFVSQTAVNATSAVISGLNASTTYFWKLYAVTEGYLSNALIGSQATSAGINKISNTSGNWNTGSIWTPAGVPTSGDNVTISNGNTVVIDVAASCNSLTVGTGLAAVLQFSSGVARTLSVNTNILINTSASFNVVSGSTSTHSLFIKGNITNNGTLNFNTGATSICNSFFTSNGNQALSGTGLTTNFNLVNINLGSSAANILDISSTNFSAVSNFLTLNNGTLKLSSLNPVNLVPFTANTSMPQSCGLWLNSANAIVTTSAGITLAGRIIVSAGVLNIGDAADEDLLLSGGTFSLNGGVTNIAGKFYTTGINNLCYFSLISGTLNVPNVGSTSTTDAPFQISGIGSQFSMTGGIINILKEGGTGTQDLGFVNTGGGAGVVTSGTLQIGNATTPAGQTLSINSISAISNLVINSSNATAKLITNSLNVTSNITISSGALNSNGMDVTLGGNWTNNGGVYAASTGSVTFNSTGSQTIFKAGGETFNHLTFTGNGAKTLSSPITAAGNFSIAPGSNVDVSAFNYSVTLKGNLINNGTLNTRNGLIFLNGSALQTIGGSSLTDFYDITLTNPLGASLSSAENLIGSLTLTSGTFNTNGQVLTMISTATATARIAQITGTGDITGNVKVQRFVPGGTTGWALLGTPLSSALTMNDWDDNIIISCPTCPDGYVNNFSSIYTYNETQPGVYDAPASYIALSGINDPIISGKGYWVYMGTGLMTTSNITIDVTGSVRKLNYTIPLNYTSSGLVADDGWNLITNPYPSAISWTALKGVTGNIDNAIYVYNADLNGGSGGYASYVNGVSSPAIASGGVGDVIPMCQGFYVHSTGATGLSAQESNKVTGNPAFLKTSSSSTTTNSVVRLNLISAWAFSDEAVLYMETGATNGFDFGYDSYKMRGQDPYAPYISIENATDQFQISGIAPITGNYTTALKTLTGYTGTYTLSADNFSVFPQGACINLYDRFTNTNTNLSSSDYVFTLEDTTTVARFILSIIINNLTVNASVTQPDCNVLTNGKISASGNTTGPWNYSWKLNGTTIKTSLNQFIADTLTNLSGGIVTLELNTVGMCDNSQTTYTIDTPVQTTAHFLSTDTFYIGQSNPVNFTNTSINSIYALWDFGDNSGFSTSYSPSYLYTSPGIFQVSLISKSSSGCSDTAFKSLVAIDNTVRLSTHTLHLSELLVKSLGENVFVVEKEFTQAVTLSLKVVDLSGNMVLDLGQQNTAGLNVVLNLNAFSKGFYLLKITGTSDQTVIKLIVL